jgi:probable HAF family extracellular repeat protein
MRIQQRLLAAMALSLVLTVPELAQAQYTFTTIDVPNAIWTEVHRIIPHALAGAFEDENYVTHGFVLHQEVFTTIDVPGSIYTTTNGVNAHGEICGDFNDKNGLTHGYFRSQRGVFTTLDPPHSVHTFATCLNAWGEVVGVYRDSAGTRHGFLWCDGVYIKLHDVPGAGGLGGGTIPLGINDDGEIVGDYTTSPDGITLIRHGFVLSDRSYTTLDPPGAILTEAVGINNEGVITGLYIDGSGFQHGFVLHHGQYKTIDVDGPYSETSVDWIDASGQVVGYFTDADGATHGFVGTPEHH